MGALPIRTLPEPFPPLCGTPAPIEIPHNQRFGDPDASGAIPPLCVKRPFLRLEAIVGVVPAGAVLAEGPGDVAVNDSATRKCSLSIGLRLLPVPGTASLSHLVHLASSRIKGGRKMGGAGGDTFTGLSAQPRPAAYCNPIKMITRAQWGVIILTRWTSAGNRYHKPSCGKHMRLCLCSIPTVPGLRQDDHPPPPAAICTISTISTISTTPRPPESGRDGRRGLSRMR
jgi:hypothetical protein